MCLEFCGRLPIIVDDGLLPHRKDQALVARIIVMSSVIVALAAGIGMAVGLALYHSERHTVAWYVGGLSLVVTVPLTLYDISMHMLYYVRPELQAYYIRILWLVIIYAVESWLALRIKTTAIYFETLREAYESYCLYCFFQMLLSYLAGKSTVTGESRSLLDKNTVSPAELRTAEEAASSDPMAILSPGASHPAASPGISRPLPLPRTRARAASRARQMLENDDLAAAVVRHACEHETAHLLPPLCWCEGCTNGASLLAWSRFGVMQYVVIKLACAVVTFVAVLLDVYGEGEWHRFDRAYIYVSAAIFCSQFVAVYLLVLFYHETMTALGGLSASAKLLLIKGLVFATWWQGLVISGMASVGWLKATQSYTVSQISAGMQDFAIVLEMMVFSAMFHYHFGFTDALPPRLRRKARGTQLGAALARSCMTCCPTDDACCGLAGAFGCAPEAPSLDPEEAEYSSLQAERDAVDYILRSGDESTAARALADMLPADVVGSAGGYLVAPMLHSGHDRPAGSGCGADDAGADDIVAALAHSGRDRGISMPSSSNSGQRATCPIDEDQSDMEADI